MAAKIAIAMGAKVTLLTTTKAKLDEAVKIGAQGVLEGDAKALKDLNASFDFILSTVSEKHDMNPFIPLLKRDKSLVVVGALEPLVSVNNQAVAFARKRIAGSLIGNLADTQEALHPIFDDQLSRFRSCPIIETLPMFSLISLHQDVA